MKMIFVSVLLCCVLFTNVYCMNDDELEKVKQMVDEELAKRQMDVVLASPNILVTKTTKKPTPKQTTMTESTKTTIQTTTTDPFDWELQHSIDNCLDAYGSKKCRTLIHDWHMDCEKDRMFDMCEKSCGYCGNHINPLIDCKREKFGCCDDDLTPRRDPFGSNCPTCKDREADLCNGHDGDCNEVGLVGEWMRTNCEETCGLCQTNPICKDDTEQAQFCPDWKKEGLCTQIPALMKAHCPKTCKLC